MTPADSARPCADAAGAMNYAGTRAEAAAAAFGRCRH